jgi:hypothetical protein
MLDGGVTETPNARHARELGLACHAQKYVALFGFELGPRMIDNLRFAAIGVHEFVRADARRLRGVGRKVAIGVFRHGSDAQHAHVGAESFRMRHPRTARGKRAIAECGGECGECAAGSGDRKPRRVVVYQARLHADRG